MGSQCRPRPGRKHSSSASRSGRCTAAWRRRLDAPFRPFHASHLARPTMSPKPGFFSLLSPTVPACTARRASAAWRCRGARSGSSNPATADSNAALRSAMNAPCVVGGGGGVYLCRCLRVTSRYLTASRPPRIGAAAEYTKLSGDAVWSPESLPSKSPARPRARSSLRGAGRAARRQDRARCARTRRSQPAACWASPASA